MTVRNRTWSKLLKSAMSLALVAGTIPAHAAGVDGIEFEPIPVNADNQCSTVILKGTDKYRGYAFKLPQVVLSMDKNYEDLFEILPKTNGQYSLRFGLMFAFSQEGIQIQQERSNVVMNSCNDNVVLAQLNEAAKTDSDNGAKKNKGKPLTGQDTQDNAGTIYESEIRRLTPLPISSVTVSLDSFQNISAFVLGTSDNNILNNQNRDLISNFNIPDEDTYTQIKSQLSGPIGLSVTIKMTFSAAAADGSTSMEIDLKSIADSLEAAGGGKLTANTVIGEADLRSYLAKAVSQQAVHIVNQEGSDDNAMHLADDIMTKIIGATVQAVPMLPGQSWNPNACINNPMGSPNCSNPGGAYGGGYGYGNYGYGQTTTPGLPDPNSTPLGGNLNGPAMPGLGTPGPSLGSQLEPANTSPNYFKVGAILNALRTGSKQTFLWENYGKVDTFSYVTTALVHGEIPDPGFKTLNVTAGTSDADAVNFPDFIHTGDTMRIKIPGHRTLVDKYTRQTTYLNTEDVTRQGIASAFGPLETAVSKHLLHDEINSDVGSGGYIATYKENTDLNYFTKVYDKYWKGQDVTLRKYNWAIDQLVHSSIMESPSDIDLPSKLKSLPIVAIFTNSGLRYPITALTQSNDLWDGSFVNGEIVLVAKQDLGYVKIRNNEVTKNTKRQPQKYIFQVMEPILKQNAIPPKGKTLADLRIYDYEKFNDNPSSTGMQKEPYPDMSAFSVSKGVYVVMIGVTSAANPSQPTREDVKITTGLGDNNTGTLTAPNGATTTAPNTVVNTNPKP